MKTKEAIEFDYINFLESFKGFVTRKFVNPPGRRDMNKRIDEIIALLQRGEKFEAIAKELKQYCLILENQNVLKEVIRLEKKYFPKKEVKK